MGDCYAFEYRIHDARLGRFLSVDPLAPEYPWNSTYAFAENSPVRFIDYLGLGSGDKVISKEGPLAYAQRNGVRGGNNLMILENLATKNPDIFPNYPLNGNNSDKRQYWFGSGVDNWRTKFKPDLNLEIGISDFTVSSTYFYSGAGHDPDETGYITETINDLTV